MKHCSQPGQCLNTHLNCTVSGVDILRNAGQLLCQPLYALGLRGAVTVADALVKMTLLSHLLVTSVTESAFLLTMHLVYVDERILQAVAS